MIYEKKKRDARREMMTTLYLYVILADEGKKDGSRLKVIVSLVLVVHICT